MTEQYDVLISGGGLVGGSLAMALNNSGLKVGLIELQTAEQKQHAPAGERVLAISQGSQQLLSQSGLWKTITDASTPIKTIQISDRGFLGKTRLSTKNEAIEALGYVLEARQLDLALVNQLEQSSIDVICPAKMIQLDNNNPASVTVTIEHENGHQQIIHTRLLVAADGGSSTIRQQLGIHARQIDYDQSAVITRVNAQIPADGIAYERFTDSGPLAFLPMGWRNYSVVWTLQPDQARQMMALSEQDFLHHLQQAFGYRLGRLTLIAKRHAFPLQLSHSNTMIAKRVALVGNAAHQLHPVAGQGFNLGLRDADCLAGLINQLASSDDDPGSDTLLNDYANARKADHQRVINFTNSLIWLFSSDWALLGHARSLGLMTLDRIPWLKRKLTKAAMGM
jgi:2-octaprenyl-6-methoxyphenol hydroxylase